MASVTDQYEAYPYPARDPADEDRRLITGSPSDPREIDHHLFGGARDWSQPLRVLVAGGGTGDGLIQIAQGLRDAGRPAEITYVDLSRAARRIAEARAARRGLTGIRFVTCSLLDAPGLGRFDYIDCCGVLHHLPDPVAGLAALRDATAPGGGMGFMVYAPHGRSGVYPLQQAFGALFAGMTPAERLAAGRRALEAVPEGHPFRRNPNLGDHMQSDAGFYDLLLHGQDRAFDVEDWLDALAAGGWALAGFCRPALYDPARLLEVPAGMDARTRMAVAEKLLGTIKVHIGYAVPLGAPPPVAAGPGRIPHLRDVPVARLARAMAEGKVPPLRIGQDSVRVDLPAAAAPLVAAVDGRRDLAAIRAHAGMPRARFDRLWSAVEAELSGWGVLVYSRLLA